MTESPKIPEGGSELVEYNPYQALQKWLDTLEGVQTKWTSIEGLHAEGDNVLANGFVATESGQSQPMLDAIKAGVEAVGGTFAIDVRTTRARGKEYGLETKWNNFFKISVPKAEIAKIV